MTYYDDNYTNYYDDYDDDDLVIYTCNESSSDFQMNALIAKQKEAELVSLMILGFFIVFNFLLYKSINKIISAQRERFVKYQLISEYYINQYGVPLTCPVESSRHLEDPDIILKHILENEAKEYNGAPCCGSEDKASDNIKASDRVKQKKKNPLDIKGNGWKMD